MSWELATISEALKTSRRFSHAKKKPPVEAVRSVCFLQHMKWRALRILGRMRNLSAEKRYKIIKHRGVWGECEFPSFKGWSEERTETDNWVNEVNVMYWCRVLLDISYSEKSFRRKRSLPAPQAFLQKDKSLSFSAEKCFASKEKIWQVSRMCYVNSLVWT